MAIIRPFKAIRPIKKYASDVAALPYDVMSREEAYHEIQDTPYSFLRVDRAETTLDQSVDIYDEKVYQKALENLNSLINKNVLVQDDNAYLYLYELVRNEQSQTGIVCCASIDDYQNGIIKKHENTRADKEEDRIKHVDTLNANTGPIFLAYKYKKEIHNLVKKSQEKTPELEFIAPDGIEHRIWVIKDTNTINSLLSHFAHVESLYIADGHHRCASAVRVGQKRRLENPDYTGEEEFNYFLSVIFSDHELKILDYNRVVKDLNGLGQSEFLSEIEKNFSLEKIGKNPIKPNAKAEITMYLEGIWYKLTAKAGSYDSKDEVEALDVSILQNNLLKPILGIEDPRRDDRIDFVGGIRGLKELMKRVDSGEMKVAFAMYPTAISELFAVADKGKLMPPKSTWFEPKLRSGLFIHHLK